MITQIKTKELLKLVTLKDLNYQGEPIEIDNIAYYIDNPQHLFDLSGNHLYQNLALYIINHQNPSIISVDLDKSKPIDSGLFEYIKAIYKKDESVYIDLPETGDNALLIKSKKLQPLEIPIKPAFNEQMVGTDSIFNQVSPENKAKFFWQTDRVDLYTSEEWVLSKIEKDLQKIVPFQKSPLDDTIKKISSSVLESESFNLALLELYHPHLNKMIAAQAFQIDFNLPVFESVIIEQIKNNNFDLLSLLFENKGQAKCNIEKLLNEDNVVEYFLKEKNTSSMKSSDSFKIYNAFFYLTPDNKRKCVHNYLECIKETDLVKAYYSESYIFQIPDYLLNEQKVLSFILPHVDEDRLKLNLSRIKEPLIKNKEFVISVADKISATKLNNIINKFVDNVDTDFLTKCIEKNPAYYKKIDNSYQPYYKLLNLEAAIIATSSKNKISHSSLNLELISPYLSENGTPREEKFKRDFVFSNKKEFSNIATACSDKSLFLEKYDKLENFFLYSEHRTDKNQKQLSKIKSPEKVKALMKKIQGIDTSLEIDYLSFYKNLDKGLQIDIKLLKDLDLLDNIEYIHLNDSLKANKEITIRYLGKDGVEIPEPFFNDIDFCLEYCRALDAKKINSIPPFVSKFFDNLEISSNYYQNLNSYILMNSLNDNLLDKVETKKKKI